LYYFIGDAVFSDFQYQQRLTRLQRHLPMKSFSAQQVYFVEIAGNITRDEMDKLRSLLNDAKLTDLPTSNDKPSNYAWVLPRLGTLSPWSSKATEIAHICGLGSVVRIESGVFYRWEGLGEHDLHPQAAWLSEIVDPMTQSFVINTGEFANLFMEGEPQALTTVPVLEKGVSALQAANQAMGLALSEQEITYLVDTFQTWQRDPTDVELMMFAQINSEHCRHKIFNAAWTIDDKAKVKTLFEMIRNTHFQNPEQAIVAYSDNAAVLRGQNAQLFFADPNDHTYKIHEENAPFVLKVETHNHPTAISPFAGAATGSGGEIRDEGATGRGSRAKVGLCGFSVSQLRIPEFNQPWEIALEKPTQMASALQIMLEGPIGAAAYNNEFGRPNVCGYFRTFTTRAPEASAQYYGYHKPIMIAGGVGQIRENATHKKKLPVGTKLIVLGGPAMAIGLGGGSASSKVSSEHDSELDFASVQRANPEMERRCQEVINACWAQGDDNPILSIHDVGAGGLSNALPELVEACDHGAQIDLRSIPNAEKSMSPCEIWCNEAQERYVLAVAPDKVDAFRELCHRERCLVAVVGVVAKEETLQVHDSHFDNDAVAMPMAALFKSMPALRLNEKHELPLFPAFDSSKIDLTESIKRVLQHPTVADKRFLIHIGDRTVGGLTARDQLVGPWQVPVADVAVTADDYTTYTGEAIAMGERTPVALLDPEAAAKLAVGEALTNLAAALIPDLHHVALSANWMAAAKSKGQAAALYDAVAAVGESYCPELGVVIPVGKDSLSMETQWKEDGELTKVTSPVSLIVTASAPVLDIRKTLTPQLTLQQGATHLLLIDLSEGKHHLGGSILAQCYQALGQYAPHVASPLQLKQFFMAIQHLNNDGCILAYHDRSDGGVFVTLCEMMFASHTGLTIELNESDEDIARTLFHESIGAVIQVRASDRDKVDAMFAKYDLTDCVSEVATINADDQLIIQQKDTPIFTATRTELHRLWSETSFRMQALRDNPDCAKQEFDKLLETADQGLTPTLAFDLQTECAFPAISKTKPTVAILREQGVNGHVEMAAAFHQAGFASVDVHMQDVLSGRIALDDFQGMAACGGFSYGDVLGAGRGWAQSILMNARAYDQFAQFFHRDDTFTLGVCNGCQMLSYLRDLIPGCEHWPRFLKNESQQFEARLALVEIMQSPSVLLQNMHDSVLPVVIAHGEGRAVFTRKKHHQHTQKQQLSALRYVDHSHHATESFPDNPNGSIDGLTGFTSQDGRATIMMPHPERTFRASQFSWSPKEWGDKSPWMKLFLNARQFVGH